MQFAYYFLLIVEGLVALGLITVILMQKSEGGGLGGGGSPTGFLSARGASDFLSRATAILGTVFVVINVMLAVMASLNHSANRIDASAAPAAPVSAPAALPAAAPIPGLPTGVPSSGTGTTATVDPLAGAAAQTAPSGQSQTPPVGR